MPKSIEYEPAFLDANIFLDVARKRKGWKASAAALSETKRRNGFISSLTVAIVYFIKLRALPPSKARLETRELIEGLQIAPMTGQIIEEALENASIEDFEDALQFHCAKYVARVIVTRNKRHFAGVENELEIITPEDFLSRF